MVQIDNLPTIRRKRRVGLDIGATASGRRYAGSGVLQTRWDPLVYNNRDLYPMNSERTVKRDEKGPPFNRNGR